MGTKFGLKWKTKTVPFIWQIYIPMWCYDPNGKGLDMCDSVHSNCKARAGSQTVKYKYCMLKFKACSTAEP